MAEMTDKLVSMDLALNVRDEDGTLYRAGRGRMIPAALAARLGGAKAKADEADADDAHEAPDAPEAPKPAPAKKPARKGAK